MAAASYGVLLKLVVEGLERLEAGAGLPTALFVLIGMIGVAAALRAAALYAMTLANNTGVQRALVDVQAAQFSALMSGDFERLQSRASGDFVSRFLNDINALRDAGLRIANNFTKGVLTILGVITTMFYMDWFLTLALLAIYPLAIAPVAALGARVRKRAKRAQEQTGEAAALLTEGFQAAQLVKAYGLEPYQQRRTRKTFQDRSRLFLKVLGNR
ncbi:MAG: ABC transporter transmembrane domain-containing protein, partial [Pseudomonadota bacterium]